VATRSGHPDLDDEVRTRIVTNPAAHGGRSGKAECTAAGDSRWHPEMDVDRGADWAAAPSSRTGRRPMEISICESGIYEAEGRGDGQRVGGR
jgi:hypothetical protein